MTAALNHPGVTLRADHLIGLRNVALHRRDAPPLSVLPGGLVSRKRGQGQEIADVRLYVSGDDMRHLDRGSTARTGELHVRSYQEDRDRVTILVADFRPSMLWGSRRAFRSVAAAEALAMIGWRVIHDGGRVGLMTLGSAAPVVIPARGRVRGMLAVIGGMVKAHEQALFQAKSTKNGDPTLASGLSPLTRIAPRGSEIIIASALDTPGAELAEELGQISQRRVPLLVQIDDAAAHLPSGVYPVRLSDGTRRRMRVAEFRAQGSETEEVFEIPMLHLDAGLNLSEMARQIDQGFASRREARA